MTKTKMLKAVILIGGPPKGTRFRPLSLDVPKPLFPLAGLPLIQHHIESCLKIPDLKEIIILGFFQAAELSSFVASMSQLYKINIRYLQEYAELGTAGGIYHFRDQIRHGDPEAFFVMNGDICADFPLMEMLQAHREREEKGLITVMATESTRQQSLNYGCIVEDKDTHEILHFVEKPSTFVSTLVNCGIYLCSLDIFKVIAEAYSKNQHRISYYGDVNNEALSLEQDVLMPLSATKVSFAFPSMNWWSQMKTAGSAIYANRHYLKLYRTMHPDRLSSSNSGPEILEDVYVHPSATVHPTAKLGPNVSIGPNAFIGEGVRIKESIILGDVTIQSHSLILYSIIGWNSIIGSWARVEGTPCDPNPNKPFAKMDNVSLFNCDGRLNPSICILGRKVQVKGEIIVLNSIVLPHKELDYSYKNEIIL